MTQPDAPQPLTLEQRGYLANMLGTLLGSTDPVGHLDALLQSAVANGMRRAPSAPDPQRAIAVARDAVLSALHRAQHHDPIANALLNMVAINNGRLTGEMVARYIDDVNSARQVLANNFHEYLTTKVRPMVVMTRVQVSEAEVTRSFKRFLELRANVTTSDPDAERQAFRSAMVSLMQETPITTTPAGEVRQ